jgi:hypothetical protein
MPALSRFLLLLLLLALDWYFDISFGRSPFEGPMSSTPVLCSSNVQKQRVCNTLEMSDLIEITPLVESADHQSSAPSPVREQAGAFILAGSELAYVFMSMQC